MVEKTGSVWASAMSGEAARAIGNRKCANRTTGDMVTSKLMRRIVPMLLCLVLAMGGLCGGLCFAQAAHHSCCHETNHCGHPGPAMQAHQAAAVAQIIPAVLTGPALVSSDWATAPGFTALTYCRDFSPTLRTSVLRL